MLRKNTFSVCALLLGLVLAASIGCKNPAGEEGPGEEGPADSVNDYSHLEPEMAPNPSRATARAGGTAEIGIPDYLLTAEYSISRAVGDAVATFRVHEDDAHIAEIVGSNTGSSCNIRGLQLGSARIIITVGGESATVIIAVTPSQAFYTLPAGEVRRVGESEFVTSWTGGVSPDGLPDDFDEYTFEPTHQLAWKWRNYDDRNNDHGASSPDCGFDVLAYFVDPVIANRQGWVTTTYYSGGWHYDLNDVTDKMSNGVQVEGDVELSLGLPEFIYDDGIPYLQITHRLTNNGSSRVTGQKFGASADVMIFNQDDAPLTYLPYGALMTNENTYGGIHYLPTLKLRLVCQNVIGIRNVSTLWLGTFPGERGHIYEDKRDDITAGHNLDTALNFSYQNITLDPGEYKEFVVRFTQVQ